MPPSEPRSFRLAKRVPAFWIGPLFFIFGLMALGFPGEQLRSGIYLLPGLLLFLAGYLSSAEAPRWRVGDRCDIRVDRERPARRVWMGAVAGVSEPQ